MTHFLKQSRVQKFPNIIDQAYPYHLYEIQPWLTLSSMSSLCLAMKCNQFYNEAPCPLLGNASGG